MGCQLNVDQGGIVLNVFAYDLASTPGGIADDVETAHFSTHPLQETGVSHPVGDQGAHPGRTLGAVVIGARHTYFFCNRLAMVANTGVFYTASRVVIAKGVA